jgi:hypothetical protein
MSLIDEFQALPDQDGLKEQDASHRDKFVWTGEDGNMPVEIDLTPTAKELEQAKAELAAREAEKSK